MIDLKGFELYLREEELSENTIDSYMMTMKQYAARYNEINKTNALEFKQSFMKFKPKTVNNKISALERYCGYIGQSLKLKRLKVQKINHVENVISEKQYKKLLECLDKDKNERWKTNILILARTGARVSEAIRITKADVIKGYTDILTKGKVRRIYIPKSLKDDIKNSLNQLQDDDKVMRGRFGEITTRGVSQQLTNFAKKYDIPAEVMHPHSFRHFFAIKFLERNKDIALLADLMGHSGVNTTMIYLRKSSEQQKKEIDKAVNW